MPLTFEQVTADELRKRGAAIASDLGDYPERSMAPVTQPVSGRPSVQDLYEKLNVLNRKPLDYSGISAVNAARKGSADREMVGGLALSLLGGKHLQTAGNHVLTKALENQNPIRPNAADVGWTNPETGDFVENPMTTRSGEEKILTGRIDALVKEQEANAKIALAAGDKRAHDVAMANSELLKSLIIAQSQQKLNNQVPVQAATVGKLERAGTQGKPLQHAEQKDLAAIADTYSKLDEVAGSFKDEFGGGLGGTPGTELMNTAVRNFPNALGKVMSPKAMESAKAKADWWQNQARLDEMVERHSNFGSALTTQELANWNKAAIRPGMEAPEIKKNFALRMELMQKGASRLRNMHIANGKSPELIGTMLDHIPNSGAAPADAGGAPDLGYPPGAVREKK